MEYANGHHLLWPGRAMMVFNGNHDAHGVITEAEVMQRADKRTDGWLVRAMTASCFARLTTRGVAGGRTWTCFT